MANMGILLNEWRNAVVVESRASGKPQLLLTAAVFYASQVYSLSYPIQEIGRSLDWINLMAYDFYDPSWYRFTWSHSALNDPTSDFSASFGINDWVQAGLAPKKLVLGLPFYGYGWQLANPQNFGLRAPATGPVVGPGFPSDNGAIGFKQIKDFIQREKATEVYNETIGTNYCYVGTKWIGFDDSQSISAKVSYAKESRLLGYFAWHVANDLNWLLSRTG
ncbi:hypothetical protein Syun_026039 [Stephania yunnanensis]|uniref:GH18 domain-containing protein n=1 Tax=Stephania yunnanensis TaxID=152371 RepID=A0AAP0F1N5_9MAGN